MGSALRSRRLANDLTQADLGRILKVTQQTIGSWERGERPQSRFLPDIADFLGLSDEAALLRLIDGVEGPPNLREATAATDNDEAVRHLAASFSELERTRQPSRDETDIFRAFIEYFGLRRD